MRINEFKEDEQLHIVQQQTIQPKESNQNTFFKDNRPEAIYQRQLQDMTNNSGRVLQLRAIQAMANKGYQSQSIFQRKANNSNNLNLPIQRKGNSTGLPNNLKSGIENLSGYSMDDVKVHYNSDKPAQIQAHAYAQGSDIHLASGQEKHLAHEAWHIVQQKQNRVKPTMQVKGQVNVNDNKGLEREADVMGAKALTNNKTKGKSDNFSKINGNSKLDNDPFKLNEVNKEAFIANLKSSIVNTADTVLAQIGQSTTDCPYIVYWFDYYQDKNPAHIQQSILRYLKTDKIDSIEEAISKVTTKVQQGLEDNIKSGSLKAVPDDVPKDLEEKTAKLKNISKAKVLQKCSNKKSTNVASVSPLGTTNKLGDYTYSKKIRKKEKEIRRIANDAINMVEKVLPHINEGDQYYKRWMQDSEKDNQEWMKKGSEDGWSLGKNTKTLVPDIKATINEREKTWNYDMNKKELAGEKYIKNVMKKTKNEKSYTGRVRQVFEGIKKKLEEAINFTHMADEKNNIKEETQKRASRFDSKEFDKEFEKQSKQDAFASTHKYVPNGIILMKKFWEKDYKKDQPGLIIHELSHLVGGTEDFGYGEDQCESFARNSPSIAIFNADNYRFFAEDVLKPKTSSESKEAPKRSPEEIADLRRKREARLEALRQKNRKKQQESHNRKKYYGK